MPSLEHKGFVDMFRENPSLAPHFLATLFHFDLLPYTSVVVVEFSAEQLAPVMARADLVLELRDAEGAPVLAIVLEVPLYKDADKKYAWPLHLAVIRARRRCPACVLVVALDPDIAAWANEAIDLGLGQTIAPIVLGPSVVPEITDLAKAEQDAELAVLSAVVHGNGPNGLAVVQALLAALFRFDARRASVYFRIVYDVLREPVRRVLMMERPTDERTLFPPFAQRLIDRGKFEGLREGEIKGKHDALLRLLARARIELAEVDRARILACTDPETLDRWLENVLGAKTAADVLS